MRPYTSERRQLQAETTRQDIVRAARELFGERGYAGTSMSDIAQRAGVAVQTIYASCGSKRELMLALVDAIDEEAGVAELGSEIRAAQDPSEAIARGVRLTRRLHERCGDAIGALLSAATIEPDVAGAAAEGVRRHREGCLRSAMQLQALGALRDDMTAEEAGALIATLTWQPVYAQLTREHGWSYDQCERWLTETLQGVLLAR